MTDEKLPPCPRCGSEVEWSNCRDLNILESGIWCTNENCPEIYFQVETMALKCVLKIVYVFLKSFRNDPSCFIRMNISVVL